MNLHREEEVDLNLSREIEDLIKDVRWLALFRVHTMRPFSHASLLNSMRNAWACAQGMTFNSKGPNLFLAQCHYLGHTKTVMDRGLCQFRRDHVRLIKYDGFTNVAEYALYVYQLWARIKSLLDGLTRKKELVEKVAKKVGHPPFTVIVNEGKMNPSSFLWVKVFVNVHEPLVRFVPINLKDRKKYPVSYEKLQDFCFFCGCMEHVVEVCGDGVHDPSTCEWGEWLHWNSEPASGEGGGQGGSGFSFERGGGSGSGRGRECRGEGGTSAGRWGLSGIPEPGDWGAATQGGGLTSRNHGAVLGEDGKCTTKRLIFENRAINVRRQELPNMRGIVSNTILFLEDVQTSTATTSEAGVTTSEKNPIVKRRMRGEGGNRSDINMTLEAASEMEDHQSQ
ncbi:hypothetical protein ZWY2020_014836 [Hordeum vulgare]|nr:hypothetical protein ZWY2020_014836 [Hordeum vulgare]